MFGHFGMFAKLRTKFFSGVGSSAGLTLRRRARTQSAPREDRIVELAKAPAARSFASMRISLLLPSGMLWTQVVAGAVQKLNSTLLLTPAPPAGSHVALAFHGDYVRNAPLCSNFFHTRQNIVKNVIRSIQAKGAIVHSFFHTRSRKRTHGPKIDELLQCAMRPAAFTFVEAPSRKISDSYIGVLDLVANAAAPIDYIVMIRFDVEYSVEIGSLPIDWGKMNYPFREIFVIDGKLKTSDLFWVFPRKFLSAIGSALRATRKRNPASARANGNGHWTYDLVRAAIGFENVRFIHERPSHSTITLADGYFLGIDRACPPSAERLADEAAFSCALAETHNETVTTPHVRSRVA